MNELDIIFCDIDEVHRMIRDYGSDWAGWAKELGRVLALRPDIGRGLVRAWSWWPPAHHSQAKALEAIGLRYNDNRWSFHPPTCVCGCKEKL